MQLLRLKIVTILKYGLEVLSKHLGENTYLKTLESVKVTQIETVRRFSICMLL
jgi:hypothetical protein